MLVGLREAFRDRRIGELVRIQSKRPWENTILVCCPQAIDIGEEALRCEIKSYNISLTGLGTQGVLPEDLGKDAVAAFKANAVERLQSLRLSSLKSLGDAGGGRSECSSLGLAGKGDLRIKVGGGLSEKAHVVHEDMPLSAASLGDAKEDYIVVALEMDKAHIDEGVEADIDSKWGASWFDQV